MKKNIALAAMVLLTFLGYAQTTFEIKSLGENYSTEQINNAFEAANFCGYYYQGKRNVITLNDGAVIELLGQNENNSLTAECVRTDDYEFQPSIWSISESGIVVRKSNTIYYKEEQK